jgi:hypothetical protein
VRIPWGRVWLSIASLLAIALAAGFALQYLGLWVTG